MNSQSSSSMLARGNPSFKNPTIELIDRSGGILLTLTDRTYKRSAAGKNWRAVHF
jgi:hypothetical protein